MTEPLFPTPGGKTDLETGAVLTPRFGPDGTMACVTVDADNGQVLMVGHMNAESLMLTIKTGEGWYWSRSRNELWHKGATSGNVQKVVELLTDCDIFDQVRAKLHKAVGRAALAEGFKEQAAEHYQRAIELHDKVGIKKELEVLEREIKKQKAAELPVASDVSAASVTAPANAEACQEHATEQQGPAPGEAS